MNSEQLVIANWKMNGNKQKILEDLQHYATTINTNKENIIFALPYLYLALAQQIVDLEYAKFQIAAQDISKFNGYGAYTGEVSVDMLPEFGVNYSIVGHSERRLLCGDTDDILMQKLSNLVKHKVTPIFCIGEPLTIRESNQYKDFLLKQLTVLVESQIDVPNLIIAYEPIWSIGTGIIPEIMQIEEVMDLIHAFVQKKLRHVKIAALYGGSVTSNNIAEILQCRLVDGVLVGGASLKVSEFTQICDTVNK